MGAEADRSGVGIGAVNARLIDQFSALQPQPRELVTQLIIISLSIPPLQSLSMATTGTPQPIERLPPELLEKVLAHMPVRDILRTKQVGRLYDQRVHEFHLNHLNTIPFARLTEVSTTSSRRHLALITASISLPLGWRIILTLTLLLPTNIEPSRNIARN